MVDGIEADLRKQSPDPTIEIAEWVSRATLDIIGVAGMGQDFNAIADPNTELNHVYRRIFQPSRAAQILSVLQFFIPPFLLRLLPLQRNSDVHNASKVARDTSRRLVQAKKVAIAEKKPITHDIVSVALESGGFTDDQLVDNMMTFLAAGHETTASAFTWAMYLLCQNLAVQTKLREEIHAHIPSLGSEITAQQIDSMPYLHAVCSETLRFYSPVPITIRDTAVDTTILGDPIPQGTKIILAPWATNYSKELWGEDAEVFNPDRWMGPGNANSGGATSNYAFLTFLHGPRSCIGQKFATAEFACLIAAFVGRFDFVMRDPDEKIDIKGGITARPKNGMHINLKKVEGW